MTEEKEQPSPKPMGEWISEEDPHKDNPEFCRPCRLGIISSWYFNELEEKGHKDLAAVIEKIGTNEEDPDVSLTLCKQLDIIKAVVDEPLRERLKEFDNATQTFNPEEVLEESAATAENNS